MKGDYLSEKMKNNSEGIFLYVLGIKVTGTWYENCQHFEKSYLGMVGFYAIMFRIVKALVLWSD